MPKTRSGARNGSRELDHRTGRNQRLNSRDSLAFASSVEALKSALHETVGGACGLVDSPKAVCEDQPKLVQEFFGCLQRLNPAVSPSTDAYPPDVAQKFRDAVTYRPTGDGRARIFFTLIDLGVEDDSDTWANFVENLHILRPENADEAFADSNLPFRELDFVKGLIGPDHAVEFQRQQYKYCPPLTQDFSGKLKDLKTLINKYHITCLRCRNTDDCHVDHNEHIETFCPDSAPSELIEKESPLVKDIYTESEKVKILNSSIQDPAMHYEAWKKAEQVAKRFLKGIKSRSKI